MNYVAEVMWMCHATVTVGAENPDQAKLIVLDSWEPPESSMSDFIPNSVRVVAVNAQH